MKQESTVTIENAKKTSEAGYSLLELLISMIIFLIVTGAIWGLLRVGLMSRTTVSEQTQLAKTMRIGLNLFSRDALNAGYGYPLRSAVILPDNRISAALGVPTDVDTTRDTVPPVIAGNNITLNTFNTAANVRTDQVTFLFKDSTFNAATGNSQSLNIQSRSTTTGGIVELIPNGGNANCRINDLFLITGPNGSTLGLATGVNGTTRVQFANGDLLGVNETALAGVLNTIAATSMYRVSMATYFVTPDGILTRREYANTLPAVAFVDEPLVYNVENFQVQYLMDSGAVSDNPSAGPDGTAGTADDVQASLEAVRQIRITLSVRSTEKNPSGQPYRETMTTTVSTRNLGYEAS